MAPGLHESVEVRKHSLRLGYHQDIVLEKEKKSETTQVLQNTFPGGDIHYVNGRKWSKLHTNTWTFVFVYLNKAKHKYIDLAKVEIETKGLGSSEQWEILSLHQSIRGFGGQRP